jgi:hypothetical protein
LVLHPETTLEESQLTAMIQAGGRVAVLDDFGAAEPFLALFGIRRLPAPTDPMERLRGNIHLPIALPVENRADTQSTRRHPVAKNVDRVVLNHPAVLTNPGLTAVLELRTVDGQEHPIAITGVVGTEHSGRLFVMSDPSSVINLMLRYPGNRQFAEGLIRYLAEDDARRDKGHLYIVANRFDQTGQFGSSTGLASFVRGALGQLRRVVRQGLTRPMLVLLAAITSLAVARWAYRVGLRRSPPSLPKFLRPLALSSQAGWPGHYASLALPSTHLALVALELRAAFREQLANTVAADEGISSKALVGLVEQRRPNCIMPIERLSRYVGELDKIERAVAERRPVRISQAVIGRLHREGLDILEHIRQVEQTRRD